tara:strand:- start:291 stop:599 length:309 start_codon:yes stop_codon:yes gene_type:complete
MGDLMTVYKALGRFLTGVVLFAFISIIVATTISEADWVQPFCKAMYWVIVVTAIVSGVFWLVQKIFPEIFKDIVENEIVATAVSELESGVAIQNKSNVKKKL